MNRNTSPLRLAYEERLKDLAEPLGSIFINNPVVQDVCEKYAHCIILTKEEALYQMVKGLCARQNSLRGIEAEGDNRKFGSLVKTNF